MPRSRWNTRSLLRKGFEMACLCVLVIACVAAGSNPASAQEPPVDALQFLPTGDPGLDTIYLAGSGSADPEGILKVEVWANDVSDLYGLSFALQFPRKLLKFPKGRATVFEEGAFLSEQGSVPTVLAVKQVDDEIIVGLTRVGEAPGVSGAGLLLTLEFRALGVAGKKRLRFRRRTAFDSTGAVAEQYSWLAGKVKVTVPQPAG